MKMENQKHDPESQRLTRDWLTRRLSSSAPPLDEIFPRASDGLIIV
jgi:hypothetical protein